MAGFFPRLCGMKLRTIVEMLMTVISLDCKGGEDPQAISIVFVLILACCSSGDVSCPLLLLYFLSCQKNKSASLCSPVRKSGAVDDFAIS